MGIGVAIPLVIGYIVVGKRKLREQRRQIDEVDASQLSDEDRALYETYHAQLNGRRSKRLKPPQLADLARWREEVVAPQSIPDGGLACQHPSAAP